MKKFISLLIVFTMLTSLFTTDVFADNAAIGENGSVTKIENTFDEFTVTNDSNTNKYQGGGNFEHKDADDDSDGKYVQVNKEIPSSESQVLYGNPANSNFKNPAVGDKYIYKADFKIVGPEDGVPDWSGVKFGAMLITDFWGIVDLGIQYEWGTWLIGGVAVSNPFGDAVVKLDKWHTLNAVAEVKNIKDDATTMEVTYYLDGVECATKGTATIAADRGLRAIASVGICNLKTVNFNKGYTAAFDNFVVAVYEGNTDLIPIPPPKIVIGFDDYDDADAWYTWKDRFEKITAYDRSYIRATEKLGTTLYRNDLFTNKKMGDLAVGQKYIYSVDFMIENIDGDASWPVASSGVILTPMVMGNWQGRNLGVSIPTGVGRGVMVYNDTITSDLQFDSTPDGTETGTQFYTTASMADENLHEDTWYTLTCVFEITGEDKDNFTGITVSYLDGERLMNVDETEFVNSTFTWNKKNTSFLSQPALYANSGNFDKGHVLAVDNLVLASYKGNTDLIPRAKKIFKTLTPVDSVYSIFTDNIGASYNIKTQGMVGDSAQVKVTDYYGKVVYNEIVSISANNTIVSLNELPVGHYTIEVTANGETKKELFAVVPELASRRDSSKSVAAFATATSGVKGGWSKYTQKPAAAFDNEEYARTIKLAGINYARELMQAEAAFNDDVTDAENLFRPSGTETDGDITYSFDYDTPINADKANGIKVLNNISNIPQSWRSDEHVLPDDLSKVYTYFKALSEYYGDKIDVHEILNEIEMNAETSSSDGPDRYAAFLKAASIAITDGNPDAKVATAGYRAGNNDWLNKYRTRVLQNDIGNYIDVYAVHSYKDRENYVHDTGINSFYETDRRFYNELKAYGLEEKPIWLTEFNMFLPLNSDNIPGYNQDNLPYDYQKAQARYAVAGFLRGAELGHDKSFYFLHGFFGDSLGTLGTMNSKAQPYAVYSAISAYNNALGNASYSGKLNNMPEGVNSAVFEEGADSIICLWTDSAVGQSVTLDLGTNIVDITDIVGGTVIPTVVGTSYTVSAGPDVIYIRAENAQLGTSVTKTDIVHKDTVTKRTLSESDRIVLLADFESDADMLAKQSGYVLSKDTVNNVTVKVFNFNDNEKTVNLSIDAHEGWTIGTPNGTAVTVPAMGSTELKVTLTANDNFYADGKTSLAISGTVDGASISKAVCSIQTDATGSEGISVKTFENYNNYRRWTVDSDAVSISNHTYIIFSKGVKVTAPTGTSCTVGFGATSKDNGSAVSSDGITFEYQGNVDIDNAEFRLFVIEEGTGSDAGNYHEQYYARKSANIKNGIAQRFTVPWEELAFNWHNSETASGDGVLDRSKLLRISVGLVLPASTAPTASIYIDNIGMFSYTSGNEIIDILDANYANNKINVTFSNGSYTTANSVRIEIDGKILDAVINGNVATADYNPGSFGTKSCLVRVVDSAGHVIEKSFEIDIARIDSLMFGDLVIDSYVKDDTCIINKGGNIKAYIPVVNGTTDEKPVVLVMTVYDESKRMVNCSLSEVNTIAGGAEASLETVVRAVPGNAEKVKFFVFDSISNIKPYLENVEMNIQIDG